MESPKRSKSGVYSFGHTDARRLPGPLFAGGVGEMTHFIQCCMSGEIPLSNSTDNVKTMELCDRILESLN